MSNQKYQCGEIVQVLFSDGRIKGESAIVVGARWCDSDCSLMSQQGTIISTLDGCT